MPQSHNTYQPQHQVEETLEQTLKKKLKQNNIQYLLRSMPATNGAYLPQQAHNLKTTSYPRRGDVMTSHRRDMVLF